MTSEQVETLNHWVMHASKEERDEFLKEMKSNLQEAITSKLEEIGHE